jgi:hypothetical protein
MDLWQEKLPKVAAKGGFGPPLATLTACVTAALEAKYTLHAARFCSRLRNSSSLLEML